MASPWITFRPIRSPPPNKNTARFQSLSPPLFGPTMISAIHDATNNNPSATGSADANISKRKRKRSSASDGATTTPSSHACAACKYQRRKCKPDCLFAPFFPASDQDRFENAHRLFGVNNMQKIVRDLDPPRRAQAMETIIYQSDMRKLDPVGGCYGVICNLMHQIQCYEAELDEVKCQIAARRAQAPMISPICYAADNGAFLDQGIISLPLQQHQNPQFVDCFVFNGEMPTDQSCISSEVPDQSIISEQQHLHMNDQQTAAMPF